ncbi:kinase domain protein, partial [Opisthorchis viverrini]
MECLMLFCTAGNMSLCQPCKIPFSKEHRKNWNAYIDAIEGNWEDRYQPYDYYSELRHRPYCCPLKKGSFCRLNLLMEPRKDPKKLYDLTCGKHEFIEPMFCNDANGHRCCNETHCNIPTPDELSILLEKPPYSIYMILVCVLAVFCIILCCILVACCCRSRQKLGRPRGNTSKWDAEAVHSQLMAECMVTPDSSSFQGNAKNFSSIPTTAVLPTAVAPNSCRTGNGGSSLSYMGSSGVGATTLTPLNTGSYSASPGGAPPFTSTGGSSVAPTLRELLEETCSGSGSGVALLVQRTVARQIQLEERIGEGRYGEVWRGVWQCDQVAAKIFSSREECSWFRETEIYQTVMLRHANILGFIAADNKDNGLSTELWLITEYHPLGSLFDFLHEHCFLPHALKYPFLLERRTHCIEFALIVSVLLSRSLMLSYILKRPFSLLFAYVQGKPAIAHRDLKSRNILVKLDGECCIGDLGFALKLDSSLSSVVDLPAHSDRVGTKRYMAPEVLDNSIRHTTPEAFKQADIYSLGLIFWEMTKRVWVYGLFGPDEYQLPYQDLVSQDPSVEEMKSIVCEQGLRPVLPTVWSNHQVIAALQDVMSECWYASPTARLPAMRVKKSLAALRRKLDMNPSLSVSPPSVLIPPEATQGLPTGVIYFPLTVQKQPVEKMAQNMLEKSPKSHQSSSVDVHSEVKSSGSEGRSNHDILNCVSGTKSLVVSGSPLAERRRLLGDSEQPNETKQTA